MKKLLLALVIVLLAGLTYACHNYMRYNGGAIGFDAEACGVGFSGIGTELDGDLVVYGRTAITSSSSPSCQISYGQTHFAGNYTLIVRLMKYNPDGIFFQCDAFDYQYNSTGSYQVERTYHLNSACGAGNYFVLSEHTVRKNNGPPILDDTIWEGESISPGDYFAG